MNKQISNPWFDNSCSPRLDTSQNAPIKMRVSYPNRDSSLQRIQKPYCGENHYNAVKRPLFQVTCAALFRRRCKSTIRGPLENRCSLQSPKSRTHRLHTTANHTRSINAKNRLTQSNSYLISVQRQLPRLQHKYNDKLEHVIPEYQEFHSTEP